MATRLLRLARVSSRPLTTSASAYSAAAAAAAATTSPFPETRVLYAWTVAGLERPFTESADKNVFNTVDKDGNRASVIDYSSNLISTLADPRLFTQSITDACQTGLLGCAPEHRTHMKDDVARRLIEYSPVADKSKARTWFGCTGSDAVSTAVWAALRGSSRTGVIVMDHSFHGAEFYSSQIGTDPRGILKRTDHMRLHTLPALPRPLSDDDFIPCLEKSESIFKYLQNEIGVMITDGSSGSPLGIPYPKGYLPALTQLAHSYGIKVIIDEVMSGLKRCGPGLMTACSRDEGLVADFITFGKALTNGMLPLSAVVVGDATEFDDSPWPHGSTFSGFYMGMAVCQDVLNYIDTPEFDTVLAEKEALLDRKLQAMVDDESTFINKHAGSGLMWTIFMDLPDADAARMRTELRTRFNARQFGMANRVMISPTIDITEEQLDHLHASLRTLTAENTDPVHAASS